MCIRDRHKVKEGDIVFPRRGEITKRAYIRKNQIGFICGTGCLKISIDSSHVASEYLNYFLSKSDTIEWLIGNSVGATMKNLSGEIIKKLPINLPPLSTQRKIASILSTYDDLIENNHKRIKLMEELAQRTYEEWFVKFRVKGEELKVKKETRLPEDWSEVLVGNLIQFQKGRKVNQTFNEPKPGFEKVLLLDGIESGNYPYTDPLNHVIAEEGDLLMLMDGARSSKVFFADRGVVGSTMARIVINHDHITPSLLKNFFDFNFEQMKVNNTGAAIPHANKAFINGMLLPQPPDIVLKAWDETIIPIYVLMRKITNQTRLLKEARDILLPRLMSGEIEV